MITSIYILNNTLCPKVQQLSAQTNDLQYNSLGSNCGNHIVPKKSRPTIDGEWNYASVPRYNPRARFPGWGGRILTLPWAIAWRWCSITPRRAAPRRDSMRARSEDVMHGRWDHDMPCMVDARSSGRQYDYFKIYIY